MKIKEYVCKVCKKVIYEDDLLCDNCKTGDNIAIWGDPIFDEERIKLELVGEYPQHKKYWEEYQNIKLEGV